MKSLVLSAIQKYVSSRGSFRFWRRVIFCVFFAVSLINYPIAASVPSENASDAAQTNAISKEKKVRVGYYHSINFSEGMSDIAVKSGLAYDYLQRVSYYTNWNYEYVYGGWSDILQMLYSGEIDVMAGVSKTPERLDKVLFPDYAMGAENYYIYANADHPLSSQGVSAIAGHTVSVNKDSIMEG
ncbi:MAG: transporter substrate-binding domain-containing protein, partial [Schwartzia sp.]|nr:transporter substrate-binding domain-containing protein [Schwartzia sp. (in: firmicutes)]